MEDAGIQIWICMCVAVKPSHRFSACAGRNVHVKEVSGESAARLRGYDHALVFSHDPVVADEIFEIRVDRVDPHWSGSISVGLTAHSFSDTTSPAALPASASLLSSRPTWVVSAYEIRCGADATPSHYASCFDRLEVNSSC